MRIAICDDEPRVAERISQFLELYFQENCIIDIFYSGTKFKDNMKGFQIIFLDIDMGDVNGIELAKSIRAVDMQVLIVFVTNHAEYTHHAFSVHAFDYLIKPVAQEQIFHVLDEIKVYREEDKQVKSVSLKGKEGLVRLQINQINYFEYSGRKVKAVLDDDILWLTYSLFELNRLLEGCDFAMPHRAFIINQRKVKAIKKHDIVMLNGDIVPIAQKKAHIFKEEFESYLYNQV